MTVLAAVDGERDYDRVVAVGKDLAEAHDEPLVVLHVMPESEFAERQEKPDYYLDTAEEDARSTSRRVVRETLGGFEGVQVAGEVGDVVETIIRQAGYREARYIVAGGERRSPVGKALFGDVTQDLLLEATCPVVTVLRDRYEAEDRDA
jgi:nucleotide-binding universal stress UspA family protein